MALLLLFSLYVHSFPPPEPKKVAPQKIETKLKDVPPLDEKKPVKEAEVPEKIEEAMEKEEYDDDEDILDDEEDAEF